MFRKWNDMLNGNLPNPNICFIEGEPSIQEILQFDPFGGESSAPAGDNPPENSAEGQPPVDNQAGEEKPDGEPEVQELPEQQAPPQGEPPKPVSQADLESLIRQQTEVIRAAVQPQQRVEPQEQQTQPRFQLGVPDALLTALRSEDPKEFSAGVGAMINGVANHVWNAVTEMIQQQVIPAVPQMIQRHAETIQRQEAVARDFYGKYPQLQIAELAPVVQTIGAQIAQEFAQQGKSLEWNAQLRDAIAERIFQRMPFLRQAAAQQNGSTPRRTFSTGTGSRPPAPASNAENEMMEMIFGGPRTQ